MSLHAGLCSRERLCVHDVYGTACTRVRMCECVYAFAYVCVSAYVNAHILISVCACVRACVRACVCACVRVQF